jgi:hypothetical protein
MEDDYEGVTGVGADPRGDNADKDSTCEDIGQDLNKACQGVDGLTSQLAGLIVGGLDGLNEGSAQAGLL